MSSRNTREEKANRFDRELSLETYFADAVLGTNAIRFMVVGARVTSYASPCLLLLFGLFIERRRWAPDNQCRTRKKKWG